MEFQALCALGMTWVRLEYIITGELIDRGSDYSCKSTRMLLFKPFTNITAVARMVELDALMHVALEFALRMHHMAKISPLAHLVPSGSTVPSRYRY